MAMPDWLAGEDAGTLILIAFFGLIVFTILSVRVWLNNNADKNESGISMTSKLNMRDFLAAILVDNVKGQRSNGLTDNDIVEMYE